METKAGIPLRHPNEIFGIFGNYRELSTPIGGNACEHDMPSIVLRHSRRTNQNIKYSSAMYTADLTCRVQNQTKPADLTTATSPFLGHRKDLSLPQTLQRAKYSLLIQSPGNAKISLIDFSAATTVSWL